MTRHIAKWLALTAAAALLSTGCTSSIITPPYGGGVTTGIDGDAWFVRNNYVILLLPFLTSSEIYWCDGEGICKKAQIR
jgi:hypothetical protein